MGVIAADIRVLPFTLGQPSSAPDPPTGHRYRGSFGEGALPDGDRNGGRDEGSGHNPT